MKPNFALGLTEDGITLWHRGGDGWLRVGAVALDDADMDSAMAALVDKARVLAPDGITTKLVIPAEHLLMTDLHAPGPGRDAQAKQIRAGLVGRTPFPAEELVFDWSGASSDVAVVVTARETLIEAEDFATAQGLNPVCFAAAQAAPGFRGEPFFGVTRAARAMGLNAETVLRDPSVLRETGIARMPAPKAPLPKIAPSLAASVTAEASAPAAGSAPVAPVAPVAQPVAQVAKAVDQPTPPATLAPQPARPAQGPATASLPLPLPEEKAAPSDEPGASISFHSRRPAGAPAPILPVPDKSGAALFASLPAPATPDPAAAHGTLLGQYGQSTARLGARLGATLAGIRKLYAGAKPAPQAGPDDTPDAALARLRGLQDLPPAQSPEKPSVPSAASVALPKLTPPAPAQAAAKPAARIAAKPAKPDQPATAATSSTEPRPSPLETLQKLQSLGPARATTSPDEAQRMTVFGARAAAERAAPDTARRPALLIAGGVLLVLVAAAIWALYFLAEPDTDTASAPEAGAQIAAPAPAAPLPEDRAETVTQALPDDPAAIEAALGAEDAAQAERPIEDGSEGAVSQPTRSGVAQTAPLASSDTALAAPELAEQAAPPLAVPADESVAGRLAEIRSNGVDLPADLSGALPDTTPPAPFGTQTLPPVRGADAAPGLADAVNEALGAAPEPARPVLGGFNLGEQIPTAEQNLQIEVRPGTPPSRPPVKPERFLQPEGQNDAAAPALDAAPIPARAAQTGNGADEQGLVIQVVQSAPPVLPPARAVDTGNAALPQAGTDVAASPAAAPAAQVDEADLVIAVAAGRPALTPPVRAVENPVATAAPPDLGQPEASRADSLPPPPGGIVLSAFARPAPRPDDLAVAVPDPAAPVFETATAHRPAQPCGRGTARTADPAPGGGRGTHPDGKRGRSDRHACAAHIHLGCARGDRGARDQSAAGQSAGGDGHECQSSRAGALVQWQGRDSCPMAGS